MIDMINPTNVPEYKSFWNDSVKACINKYSIKMGITINTNTKREINSFHDHGI